MVSPVLNKNIFSVSQLSNIIGEVFQGDLFQNIKVRGEIVSKSVKKGNVYLTLIDSSNPASLKKDTLSVIIFSWYDAQVGFDYKAGDKVVVTGDMSYYGPFGKLSLNAKYLVLDGEGQELIKLKELREKLEREGLFAPERKRKLPAHISKIAIITSASGAAYHDIMQTLEKKMPVSTVLFDAVVQGNNASVSLIKALSLAYKSDADIIIFGRGGGSKTDLDCFNNESVVRKLAESPIPVISGIGHEIDTSLSDLVSDIYAITPTAAADKALPNLEDVLGQIAYLKERLETNFMRVVSSDEIYLSRLEQNLERYSPLNIINIYQTNLYNLTFRLINMTKSYILSRENTMGMLSLNLEKAYKFNAIQEGMAYVQKGNRKITSVDQLSEGEEIELGFKDGVVSAKIKEVKQNGKEKDI